MLLTSAAVEWVTARVYPHVFKIISFRQQFPLCLIVLTAFNENRAGQNRVGPGGTV
jgi:hypothetical protein